VFLFCVGGGAVFLCFVGGGGGPPPPPPPGVAPEASEEWFDFSKVLMPFVMPWPAWLFPSWDLIVARVHGQVPSF
jgi:hypothetical protein